MNALNTRPSEIQHTTVGLDEEETLGGTRAQFEKSQDELCNDPKAQVQLQVEAIHTYISLMGQTQKIVTTEEHLLTVFKSPQQQRNHIIH